MIYRFLVAFLILPVVSFAANDSLLVREPYHFKNLSIFLLEASDVLSHPYLTLEQALAYHHAIIHENNSQTLWIENLSDTDLYIQSGDLIKGGQQDRMIESDMILPAHETSHDLRVFCIEKGRSSQRGQEPISTFSGSTEMAPLSHMRVIADHELTSQLLSTQVGGATAPDTNGLKLLQTIDDIPQFSNIDNLVQESIWNDVANVQTSLSDVLEDSVTKNASPTSLELTLEHASVVNSQKEFEHRLLDIIKNSPRSIGVVYAIDGSIVGADSYGSHEVFVAMWSKLLKAMATESMVENEPGSSVSVEDVQKFLRFSSFGKDGKKDVNMRTTITASESFDSYRFITIDTKYKSQLHSLTLNK